MEPGRRAEQEALISDKVRIAESQSNRDSSLGNRSRGQQDESQLQQQQCLRCRMALLSPWGRLQIHRAPEAQEKMGEASKSARKGSNQSSGALGAQWRPFLSLSDCPLQPGQLDTEHANGGWTLVSSLPSFSLLFYGSQECLLTVS